MVSCSISPLQAVCYHLSRARCVGRTHRTTTCPVCSPLHAFLTRTCAGPGEEPVRGPHLHHARPAPARGAAAVGPERGGQCHLWGCPLIEAVTSAPAAVAAAHSTSRRLHAHLSGGPSALFLGSPLTAPLHTAHIHRADVCAAQAERHARRVRWQEVRMQLRRGPGGAGRRAGGTLHCATELNILTHSHECLPGPAACCSLTTPLCAAPP